MITTSVSLLPATLFLRRFECERRFVQAAVPSISAHRSQIANNLATFQRRQRPTVPSRCSLCGVLGTFSHPCALTEVLRNPRTRIALRHPDHCSVDRLGSG